MLDRIIETCAGWDWVTPVVTFIQNWQRSPSVTFLLPFGYSLSAWEIARHLKRNGLDVWGVMVIGDTIYLQVREAESPAAERLLQMIGVPYVCTVSSGQQIPSRWEDREREFREGEAKG